jgi:hypothetical protein
MFEPLTIGFVIPFFALKALANTRNPKNAPLGSDNVMGTLLSDVELMLCAGGCGAAGVILRILTFSFMSNNERLLKV